MAKLRIRNKTGQAIPIQLIYNTGVSDIILLSRASIVVDAPINTSQLDNLESRDMIKVSPVDE